VRWNWQPVDGKNAVIVSAVARGSGAAQAGLRPGDRITAVDGDEVNNDELLPAAVLRAAKEITLTVAREKEESKDIHVPLGGQPVKLGLSWREDPAAPGAVFITRVVPYSPAARAGIRVLDRIYSVQGERFTNQDALLTRINALMEIEETPIHFQLETAGRLHDVDISLKLPTGTPGDASI
jgi:S1-C subfamily serine protease